MTEKWSVEADGKGAFNACFEIAGLKSAALSGVSQAEAQAHVDRAIRTNAERDAKLALVDHLFNKEHWKLETERAVVTDLVAACAMRDALAFFCGGAEIRCLPNGRYSVGSLGYFHYVGA